jgi:hypothetical protein
LKSPALASTQTLGPGGGGVLGRVAAGVLRRRVDPLPHADVQRGAHPVCCVTGDPGMGPGRSPRFGIAVCGWPAAPSRCCPGPDEISQNEGRGSGPRCPLRGRGFRWCPALCLSFQRAGKFRPVFLGSSRAPGWHEGKGGKRAQALSFPRASSCVGPFLPLSVSAWGGRFTRCFVSGARRGEGRPRSSVPCRSAPPIRT